MIGWTRIDASRSRGADPLSRGRAHGDAGLARDRVGDVSVGRHAIEQQRPDKRGLSGTDFAGELNEALRTRLSSDGRAFLLIDNE